MTAVRVWQRTRHDQDLSTGLLLWLGELGIDAPEEREDTIEKVLLLRDEVATHQAKKLDKDTSTD